MIFSLHEIYIPCVLLLLYFLISSSPVHVDNPDNDENSDSTSMTTNVLWRTIIDMLNLISNKENALAPTITDSTSTTKSMFYEKQ